MRASVRPFGRSAGVLHNFPAGVALTLQLAARLEKVTGAKIAELAKYAEGWPVDV